MNRGQAPPRVGPAISAWSSQDARSSLVPQSSTATNGIKLKKKAVKIASVAPTVQTSAPSAPSRDTAPSNEIASKHQPVKSSEIPMKPVEGHVPKKPEDIFKALRKPEDRASPISTPSKASDTGARDLESMLASLRISPSPAQARPSVAKKENEPLAVKEEIRSLPVKLELKSPVANEKPKIEKQESGKVGITTAEEQYLAKANEYLQALPTSSPSKPSSTIKTVAEKLQIAYKPQVELDAKSADSLKSRYVFAVVNYVNKLQREKTSQTTQLTASHVQTVLEESDGNFLRLIATMAHEKYIKVDNLDQVAGLCSMILDALPKAEIVAEKKAGAEQATSIDRMQNATAWPTQQKRENAPGHRICLLKGRAISEIRTLNQLQALVWGGKIEAMALPDQGSTFATFRFMTPEACSKYFNDTENGLQPFEDKTKVILVEKTSGPNSANDIVQNCISGGVTRCVKAVGVKDEDWSDAMLLKLAIGNGKTKREVDRVKRGKTARGHDYVEFRFANILNALSFKRELMDDVEWEQCSISWATDPCEIANGIHHKDEDERESS